MSELIRVKTSEIEGDLLDCLVACAINPNEKIFYNLSDGYTIRWVRKPPPYSTDWSHGGPLIEKHVFRMEQAGTHTWLACMYHSVGGQWLALTGPTLLIAAMRAIVASELGDTVEVPKELVT